MVVESSDMPQIPRDSATNVMVRTNVTKRGGLGKSFRQFKAPKRTEITRLPSFDDTDTGTPTTVKVLGKGSGKYSRPLVSDLIRLWDNESKLLQELADEKARAQAHPQAALAAQEADFAKRIERIDALTKADVPPTQTISLRDEMVYSDSKETPEKPKRSLKRPLPDDDV